MKSIDFFMLSIFVLLSVFFMLMMQTYLTSFCRRIFPSLATFFILLRIVPAGLIAYYPSVRPQFSQQVAAWHWQRMLQLRTHSLRH